MNMYLRFLYIKRVCDFVFVSNSKRKLIFDFHFLTRHDVYAPNCACKSCNRCPTDPMLFYKRYLRHGIQWCIQGQNNCKQGFWGRGYSGSPQEQSTFLIMATAILMYCVQYLNQIYIRSTTCIYIFWNNISIIVICFI